MLSIQEIGDKYSFYAREMRSQMDATATYHPDSVIAELNREGVKFTRQDQAAIRETLRAVPWNRVREYLAKGSTVGNYFIGDKVHDTLVMYSQPADICPLISAHMVEGWEGGDLDVDIPSDTGYKASEFVSFAVLQTETVEVKKATLSPISFHISPRIGEDLVEDTNFQGGLVEWHLKNAAVGLGEYASNLAVTVLKNPTDGWGTKNSGNAGADETTWANIETALAENVDDRFPSNTVLINPEAWEHSVRDGTGEEVAGGAAGDYWGPYAYGVNIPPVAAGFDFKIETLDFKKYICDANHAAYPTDTTAMTNCVTLVFDRNNALLTGRKLWMQITDYAEPWKDLAGAVVKCRQDSVSLYNDCVYVLSET